MRKDVFIGVTDVETWFTDHIRRFRLVQWLGRETFFGERAYSIRDLGSNHQISWPHGTIDTKDITSRDVFSGQMSPVNSAVLDTFSQPLRYAAPLVDIYGYEPVYDIHRDLPLSKRVENASLILPYLLKPFEE